MSQVATYHIPDFHFDYYSIIPHKTQPQLLMVSNENGWCLPHFVPYEHHFGIVDHINQEIKVQLGLNVTTLHCFHEDYSRETKTGCRVYAMENHSPQWTLPRNARWIEFHQLDSLTFVIPKLRQILKSWVAEILSNNIPELRVTWAKIGWFEKAVAWINVQLNNLGLSATAPIIQVKSWGISCLLKVNTTSGNLYLKAAPTTFANEPKFTYLLSKTYPNYFPKILAVDTEEQWMLMRDFGGKHLAKITDISQWKAALRLFAEMQIQAVEQVDKLLILGFPDRQVDRLTSQIDPLFADTSALVPQTDSGLSETEIETLRSLTSHLKEMCRELAVCGIPSTLIHGDLHPQNVVVTDGKHIYFDWSDAAISHPFFDIVNFLQKIEEELPDVADMRIRLRNVYLESWTIYLPMEQLILLFHKTQPLAALYSAIIYSEITQNLEASQKWQMAGAVPFFLKTLIKQIHF
ncbi:MAG: aminoglycoside phosphotransferase family protein [Hassallia sp. WJT32-NPBG1]|jgi:thiamine kinase-like enzyme|nr:aminoglycoside phosphotransferase family protein [Hassallia sp. WJT32-NPBG1]